MEVVVLSPGGSPTMDPFDFGGARTSPYLSAPSSPKRFGEYNYLSAPTSPSRISEFYSDFDYFSSSTVKVAASPSIPFGREQKGGDDDDGFAFFVNRESDRSSRSAEELFDGGKIKPLELEDDELFASAKSPLLSPKQPNHKSSPIAQGKKVIREAFSPRKKKESGNPFNTASDSSTRREGEQRRGRDRTPAAVQSSSNAGRRVTRSHSPYRISPYTWEEEQQQQHPQQQQQSITKEESTLSSNSRASLSSTSSSSSSKSSRKWRLRDFLLFRSASEGRGTGKDPFRKYPVLFKKPEEGKNQSFRSSSDNPTSSAHGSRRKGTVSAHELHYAKKKAESEDLKKRTFLPYKQGILGRLAGLGSLTR